MPVVRPVGNPQNVLSLMQQGGANQVYNPSQSQGNALGMALQKQALEQRGGNYQSDRELKVIEIAKKYLPMVNNEDDFKGYKAFMTEKIGANPILFPDTYTETWKESMALGLENYIKMKQGSPFSIYKKEDDGSYTKLTVKNLDQFQQLKDSGKIDDSWELGEPEQPKYKSEAQLKKELKYKKEEIEAKKKADIEKEKAKKSDKVPSRVKAAIDTIKAIKDKSSDSAAAVLAKVLAGQAGIDDTEAKSEMTKAEQIAYDGAVQVLNKYYEGINNAEDLAKESDSHVEPIKSSNKVLTKELAMDYLNKAGGDKKKAREMAKKDGYKF